jgi:hypothetical protein
VFGAAAHHRVQKRGQGCCPVPKGIQRRIGRLALGFQTRIGAARAGDDEAAVELGASLGGAVPAPQRAVVSRLRWWTGGLPV